MGPEGVNLSLSSFKMRSPAWHMVAVYRLIQQPAPFSHLMGGRSHPNGPLAGCEIVKQLIKAAKRPADKSRAGHTICHHRCVYHGNPAGPGGAASAQGLAQGEQRPTEWGSPSLPLLPRHLSRGGGAPHTQPLWVQEAPQPPTKLFLGWFGLQVEPSSAVAFLWVSLG